MPGVLLDRVNIGGNETGQAPTVVSKGTRPQDTVWTLDGIVITDMAAAGLPPTYFNFDNFEEIQVSTAGQDIKQQTGGVGINLVTKRGTNQFHGGFRGYFANDALEAVQRARRVAHAGDAGDGGPQQADFGFRRRRSADPSAPTARGSTRPTRRRTSGSCGAPGALVDRTQLKNPSR